MNSRGQVWAWWLCSVVGSLAWPTEASACSPRPDAGVTCVERVWVSQPPNGATEVPTNARFTLVLNVPFTFPFGPPPEPTPIVRRASDGARVELTREASTGMLAPTTELDAMTEYVVYDVGAPDACDETSPAVEVEVARFTTGAGPDLTPPAPPVVHGMSECHTDTCDSGACCGPYSVTGWWLEYDRSPDADVVAYRSEDGFSDFGFGQRLVSRGPDPVVIQENPGPSRLSIVAIDHAGNRSTATAPVDASRCAPTTIEAGTLADGGRTPEAGVRTDAGMDAGPSASPGGCVVGASSRTSWVLSVAGLVVLSALARRRRSAR